MPKEFKRKLHPEQESSDRFYDDGTEDYSRTRAANRRYRPKLDSLMEERERADDYYYSRRDETRSDYD